jgi:hypothetical protein
MGKNFPLIIVAGIIGLSILINTLPKDDKSVKQDTTLSKNTPLKKAHKMTGNVEHDRLSELSDSERNTFLTAFLYKSGENCDAVVRNFFQGTGETGDASWNIECRNKKAYSVMIYNDSVGSTKILDCAVLKALNAGECFQKF